MTQTSDMTAYYQKIRDAVSKGAYIVTEEDLGLPSLHESLAGYNRLIANHLEMEKTLKIINEGVEKMEKIKEKNGGVVPATPFQVPEGYHLLVNDTILPGDLLIMSESGNMVQIYAELSVGKKTNTYGMHGNFWVARKDIKECAEKDFTIIPREAILSLHDKTFNHSIVTMPADFMEVGNGTIQKGDLLKYKCGQIAEASLTIGKSVENYAPFFKVYRDIKVMKNNPSFMVTQTLLNRASQLGYSTEEEIITALKQHSKMVEAMK